MTTPLTRVAGRPVLFVMAAEAEYGPHLKRLFTPLMTGIGPVEAGVRLGAELARLRPPRRFPISSSRSAPPVRESWSKRKSIRRPP